MSKPIRQPLIDKLAVAVAGGASVSAAARAVGIPIRTASDLSARPEFRATVDRIRSAVMSESVGKLVQAAVLAVDALTALLSQEDPGLRHRVSSTILSHCVAVRTHAELTTRIDDLAAQIAELRSAGGTQ